VFWINLPLGLLALWLVQTALAPLGARGVKAPLDALGAVWLVLGLAALLIPITRIGQGVPWNDPLNGGVLLAALPLLAGFLWHETRVAAPIVPLQLLRIRSVAACCALPFLCFVVMITLSVMVPLRAQWVQGLSVDDSAWRMLCMSMGIPTAAFLSGRYMYRRARVRPLLRWGMVIVPAALLVLAQLPATVPAWIELPCLFLLGLGFGLQLPASLVASQHAVGRELIGTVTALGSLARQLGGAIGVAVLSALLLVLVQAQYPALQQDGLEGIVRQLADAASGIDRSALDGSFRAVLWGCLACALLAWPFVGWLPDTRLDEH
jgi:hypothetical protein